MRRGGRKRNLDARPEQIQAALRREHLEQPALVAGAFTASTKVLVDVLASSIAAVVELEGELEASFGRHSDADLIRSQPGLGVVLGAWVLAEFGDDPDRVRRLPAGGDRLRGVSPTALEALRDSDLDSPLAVRLPVTRRVARLPFRFELPRSGRREHSVGHRPPGRSP